MHLMQKISTSEASTFCVLVRNDPRVLTVGYYIPIVSCVIFFLRCLVFVQVKARRVLVGLRGSVVNHITGVESFC